MNGHKYTAEQDEFMREYYSDGVSACVQKFNDRFGTELSYAALKSHANKTLKLATGLRPWTDEWNAAIAETLQKYSYKQATEIFNQRFGTNFSRKQIEAHCTKCGIKRERATYLRQIDKIIADNIGKSYEEIRQIIYERTGKEYRDYTAVCVRANKRGLNRPHRVWHKDDKRTINGEIVTFSEFVRFIGNRWHRIAPELQPIALRVVKLQSEIKERSG